MARGCRDPRRRQTQSGRSAGTWRCGTAVRQRPAITQSTKRRPAMPQRPSTQRLRKFAELPGNDSSTVELKRVEETARKYRETQSRVFALGRKGAHQDAAEVSDGAGATDFDEAIGAIDALTDYVFTHGRAAADQVASVNATSRTVILGLGIGALVAGIALASLIGRHLVGQLGGEPREAVRLARAVATGDLCTRVELHGVGSESLMAQLAAMQSSLQSAVAGVRGAAEHVAGRDIGAGGGQSRPRRQDGEPECGRRTGIDHDAESRQHGRVECRQRRQGRRARGQCVPNGRAGAGT